MVSRVLKCPYCGGTTINAVEGYDEDFFDNKLIQSYCGICMDCQNTIMWKEHYYFDHFDIMKSEETD